MEHLVYFILSLGLCLLGSFYLINGMQKLMSSKLTRFFTLVSSNRYLSSLFAIMNSAVVADNLPFLFLTGSLLQLGQISIESSISMTIWGIIGAALSSYIVAINIEYLVYFLFGASCLALFFLRDSKYFDKIKVIYGIAMLLYGIQLFKVVLGSLQNSDELHAMVYYVSHSTIVIFFISFLIKTMVFSIFLSAAFAISALDANLLDISQIPIWFAGSMCSSVMVCLFLGSSFQKPYKQLTYTIVIYYMVAATLAIFLYLLQYISGTHFIDSALHLFGSSHSFIVINSLIFYMTAMALLLSCFTGVIVRFFNTKLPFESFNLSSPANILLPELKNNPGRAIELIQLELINYVKQLTLNVKSVLEGVDSKTILRQHQELANSLDIIGRFISSMIQERLDREEYSRLQIQSQLLSSLSIMEEEIYLKLEKSDLIELHELKQQIFHHLYQLLDHLSIALEDPSQQRSLDLIEESEKKDKVIETCRALLLTEESSITYVNKNRMFDLTIHFERIIELIHYTASQLYAAQKIAIFEEQKELKKPLSRKKRKDQEECQNLLIKSLSSIPHLPFFFSLTFGAVKCWNYLIFLQQKLLQRSELRANSLHSLYDCRRRAFEVALDFDRWFLTRSYVREPLFLQEGLDFLMNIKSMEISQEKLRENLEFVTASRAIPIGDVTFYPKNSEDFQRRIDAIEGAKKSIEINYWLIRNDETGERFLDALIKSCKRGVKVTIALDKLELWRELHSDPSYRHFIQRLLDGGIHLYLIGYRKWWISSHVKILIIDGDYCVFSGRNIENATSIDNLDHTIYDLDLHFQGGVVKCMEERYWYMVQGLEPIKEQGKTPSTDQLRDDWVLPIDHQCFASSGDLIFKALITAILHATKTIDIIHGHFIPNETMIHALIHAKERGVAVRILTNSLSTLDDSFWTPKAYEKLRKLFHAGIEIYLMKEHPLHIKSCLFDGNLCCFGGYDLVPMSHWFDCDQNLFIKSERIVPQLSLFLDLIRKEADPIRQESDLDTSSKTFSSWRDRVLLHL